jgi:uracil phosphoribosyltransferase
METKLKERMRGNGLFGMNKNFEVLYQRATKKISVKTSEVATPSFTPYEISELQKAHIVGVELRRSQALAEAQRHNIRGR